MKFSALVAVLLGLILVVRITWSFLTPVHTRSYPVGDATVVATLDQEPVTTSRSQKMTVSGLEIVKKRFPQLSYGDRVEFKGIISNAEGKPKMLFPQVKVLENPKNFDLVKSLFDFKKSLIMTFQKLLPEPEAGLMSGILLGSKTNLDSATRRDIQNTGLTHVVVASGANLTFVSGLVFGLALLIVGRRWANLLAIPMIWLYAVMTDFEPAVTRAAIMVSFIYLAQFFGRNAGTWRGLVVAVYVMILFDPFILTNLGFQLSVAAVSGIIMFGGGTLKQTLGAQIMTLPLIVGTFGRYGLLSLISNLLVLWTIPLIMALGALAGVISLGSTELARAAIFPAQILLSYFVMVVSYFGRFESLVLTLPQLDPIVIMGIYLIIIAIYVQRRVAQPVDGIRA